MGESDMIRRTILAGVLCGLVFSITLASTGWAQTEPYDVEATWTAPSIGTPPVMYHVWVRSKEDGTEVFNKWEKWHSTSGLKQILTFEKGRCYEVKINAEDKDQVLGPFSIPSWEYCGIDFSGGDNGGPGQPGQPIRIE
jgi:hypothetical protein